MLNILPSSLFKWICDPLRTKRYLFVERASPYHRVNTLLLGYRNQLVNSVQGKKVTDCLRFIQTHSRICGQNVEFLTLNLMVPKLDARL